MKTRNDSTVLSKRSILQATYALSLVGAILSLGGIFSELATHLQFRLDRIFSTGMLHGASEQQKSTLLLYLAAAVVGLITVGLILCRLLRRRETYEGLAAWERAVILVGIVLLAVIGLSVWTILREEIGWSESYSYEILSQNYLHGTELRGLTATLALYLGLLLLVDRWFRRRAVAEQIKAAEDDLNRRLDP